MTKQKSVQIMMGGDTSGVQGANYICFQGPEKELPQGDTTYATSITAYKGMDDANDIIVRSGISIGPAVIVIVLRLRKEASLVCQEAAV